MAEPRSAGMAGEKAGMTGGTSAGMAGEKAGMAEPRSAGMAGEKAGMTGVEGGNDSEGKKTRRIGF